MIALFTVVMISYFLLLLFLSRGWKRVSEVSVKGDDQLRGISILVPFRNEANHIHHLIRSLTNLNYPSGKFEVILVNDHSNDNSQSVVKALIHDKPNFTMIDLDDKNHGKKLAITFGVTLASHELIATTDADCIIPTEWLQNINKSFVSDKVKMVFGGVSLKTNVSFFSKLQAIELASLIGTGGATMGYRFLTMCNGANLAFRKATFTAVGGYDGNLNVASGDDEFLARKIINTFSESLNFISETSAVVISRPSGTLKSFIHQRLRWAGKWRYNSSIKSKLLTLYILIVQLTTLGLIASLIIIDTGHLIVPLSLIVVKLLFECGFLYPVCRFLQVKWNWSAFFVLQFIYPLYVIGIGIMSQTNTYEWKGRRLSHKM